MNILSKIDTPIKWLKNHFIALTITSGIVFILVSDLYFEKIEIETSHVIILALVMLPWMGRYVDSFKLTTAGLEAIYKDQDQRIKTLENNEEVRLDSGETDDQVAPYTETIDTRKKAILRAISNSNFSLRSWSGIRNDIAKDISEKLSKSQTVAILTEMQDDGFVRKIIGPKSGRELWSITTKGLQHKDL